MPVYNSSLSALNGEMNTFAPTKQALGSVTRDPQSSIFSARFSTSVQSETLAIAQPVQLKVSNTTDSIVIDFIASGDIKPYGFVTNSAFTKINYKNNDDVAIVPLLSNAMIYLMANEAITVGTVVKLIESTTAGIYYVAPSIAGTAGVFGTVVSSPSTGEGDIVCVSLNI